MTPRTVNVVCARTSVKVGCVPAIRDEPSTRRALVLGFTALVFRCSFCGARVRVVA